MPLGIRGSNPIWLLADLQGNLFDDTFYMYVLQNTLPYIPATVYHDPDLSVPWTNPIQFLANGTLPIDIFFEEDVVYRLEFRQNNGIDAPSQSDPLIYEVNDYVPGTGGSTPVDTVALTSSNQITNPQFSLVSFNPSIVLSSVTNPDPVEVAPGWFLELFGTGSATIERVALNDTNTNPSNAPYALHLTLSGWDAGTVFLRQRFDQNGMLWANKIVSSAVTARMNASVQSISAVLIDSNPGVPTSVLDASQVSSTFNEFTGYGQLPATTNPDVPPDAYIEYRLMIPSNVDIYLTSFQLVVQDLPIQPSFEQDSIERQADHTWHYYKDSVIMQPKSSVLAGWQFGLNPYQLESPTVTTLADNAYAADQTLVIQQNYVATGTGNNIQTGRASAALNYGFEVSAVTASNQFAMIQYIDARSIRPYWGYKMSSLVKLIAQKQNSAQLRVKMMLAWRASLPAATTQIIPVASWVSGQEPVLSAGWTIIKSKNDPVYSLVNGQNVLTFDGFQLPAGSTANDTLAVIVYTVDNMIQTGTPDNIVFDSVSLVPNAFAIESNVITWDQCLAQCSYYLETSFPQGTTSPAATQNGLIFAPQGVRSSGGNNEVVPQAFNVIYRFPKRAIPSVVRFYDGVTTTPDNLRVYLYQTGGAPQNGAVALSAWTTNVLGDKVLTLTPASSAALLSVLASGTAYNGFIGFQYMINSRLGV